MKKTKETSRRQQAAQQCAAVLDEKFFKAFSEPARAAVFQQVVLLGNGDIGAIAERLPQDRSVVSRHLQVLADAGVLTARKEGRRIFYAVNAAEIERRLVEMLELTRQLAAADSDSCACAMVSQKISCAIRCLDPETVRAAKNEMKGAAIGKVPFVCKVSGKKEDILLLSDESAQRLASLPDAIGGPLTQKIVYAILGAELCECDIATLTEGDEGQVLDELERLRSIGIVKCREIEGMQYYALRSANMEDVLAKHLTDLESL